MSTTILSSKFVQDELSRLESVAFQCGLEAQDDDGNYIGWTRIDPPTYTSDAYAKMLVAQTNGVTDPKSGELVKVKVWRELNDFGRKATTFAENCRTVRKMVEDMRINNGFIELELESREYDELDCGDDLVVYPQFLSTVIRWLKANAGKKYQAALADLGAIPGGAEVEELKPQEVAAKSNSNTSAKTKMMELANAIETETDLLSGR